MIVRLMFQTVLLTVLGMTTWFCCVGIVKIVWCSTKMLWYSGSGKAVSWWELPALIFMLSIIFVIKYREELK